MDWIAFVLSVVAALLNALKNKWCWIWYLVSNVAWVIFAFTSNQSPLLLSNLVFFLINCLGLYNWWKSPKTINEIHPLQQRPACHVDPKPRV